MPNLPTPGGSAGTWADDLNDTITVGHNNDGTHKSAAITSALGYTPVNKAGDTSVGNLNLGSNTLTAGTGAFTTLNAKTGGAALVVAASNAPTRVKAQADYVCDGIADQNEINTALADGLHVRLTEGTFSISGPILVQQDNATLQGAGTGGQIDSGSGGNSSTTKLTAASGLTTEMVLVQGASDTRPVNGATIRDLACDGASLAGPVDGIIFRSHNGLIENVSAAKFTGSGIKVAGYSSWNTYNTVLRKTIAAGNGVHGFFLADYSSDLTFSDCHGYNNTSDGLRVDANTSNHQISACHFYSNDHGIYMTNGGGTYVKVIGCKIELNNSGGIYADGAGAGVILITGCGFRCNSQTTTNTTDDINIAPSSAFPGNVIVGNTFYLTGAKTARYGINLGSNTRKSFVVGNAFGASIFGTASYLNSGTDNTIICAPNAGTSMQIEPPSAGLLLGASTSQKLGVWNATPVARQSAYTQTYATADKTHANFTSSDLTGITSSTTGSALAEPSVGYTQSEMQQNFRRIQDQFVALRADVADLKQLVNAVIDDFQTIGWLA